MAKEPKEKAPPDEEIEEIIRNIADRLAAARKARGLTQTELGQLADLSQSRIFELEQGTANVTVRTLARMAKVLDVDLHSLFIDSGVSAAGQLSGAIDRFVVVLEERGLQEQTLKKELLDILGRSGGLAVRSSQIQSGAVGKASLSPTKKSEAE